MGSVMPTTFVQLRTRLEAMAPARDGTPASYDALVLAAMEQLSQDAPMVRRVDLQVVAGTATYALPDDFMTVLAMDSTAVARGVLVTDVLTVVGSGYTERWYEEGTVLRVAPTPTYSALRTLHYAARHVLDESGAYPYLSVNGARIALMYAAHLVLTAQAGAAGGGWKYQIGDEMVDKSRVGEGLTALAASHLQQYRLAVGGLKGYGGQWAPARVGSANVDLL